MTLLATDEKEKRRVDPDDLLQHIELFLQRNFTQPLSGRRDTLSEREMEEPSLSQKKKFRLLLLSLLSLVLLLCLRLSLCDDNKKNYDTRNNEPSPRNTHKIQQTKQREGAKNLTFRLRV